MINYIVAGIILILLGSAIAYIIKEKKRGVKCIGCPAAGSCAKNSQNGGAGCSCSHTQNK